MTSNIDDKIFDIVRNFAKAETKNLSDRISKPIIKGNNIGFAFDIEGMSIDKANNFKNSVSDLIQRQYPQMNVSIVLTKNTQHNPQKSTKSASNNNGKIIVDGVKKIFVVASGKGGVGKSTITAGMAYNLNKQGYKVGVLDADITGPSQPHIFGIHEKPDLDGKKMIPPQKNGIFINSIGFMTKPGSSINWRGPMISKALYQLLSLTLWPDLDFLIIDTPPGTSDVHLSLLENYYIDQFALVTTPQKLAKIDAARTANLYEKFSIPLFAIIENMGHIAVDQKQISLFNQDDKLTNLAPTYYIPFLPELGIKADNGESLEEYSEYFNIKYI